jgi:hypothetical protein
MVVVVVVVVAKEVAEAAEDTRMAVVEKVALQLDIQFFRA